jgi:hypothetical protein
MAARYGTGVTHWWRRISWPFLATTLGWGLAAVFGVIAAIQCRGMALNRTCVRSDGLSEPKLLERIDMWVARYDPAGLRVPGRRSEDR